MVEMGNQQVRTRLGLLVCWSSGGHWEPLGDLPLSFTPWCGAGTSFCSPSSSCSHPSPHVLWLSFSLAGLMQG